MMDQFTIQLLTDMLLMVFIIWSAVAIAFYGGIALYKYSWTVMGDAKNQIDEYFQSREKDKQHTASKPLVDLAESN